MYLHTQPSIIIKRNERRNGGFWIIDLSDISYRELHQLGQYLSELGEKGSIEGTKFDLSTLTASFDVYSGNVEVFDREGNSTEPEEEE